MRNLEDMRLGYCCINKSLGNKGNFRTMTVSKANKLTKDERYLELQKRTRENFRNLLSIMKYNVDKNISMYRVSSSMSPLYTHEICNYDFAKDKYILNLCKQIKQMAQDNDIRLTIHPDQYNVINSTSQNVLNNTIKNLEYHYKLVGLLGIEVMCIHVGGKAGGIEVGKKRFVDNFKQIPEYIQRYICLENDDKSYNVENTLNICKQLNIPMIFDWHHDRILSSSNHCTKYMNDIISTWNGRVPVAHISSSANEEKLVSKHHDRVNLKDFNQFVIDTGSNFDVEFECKDKELSLMEIKFILNKFTN